jgi:hemolysin III
MDAVTVVKGRRDYTLGEEVANSIIHGLGIGLSVAALVLLVMYALRSGSTYVLASGIVFGVSLVLEYTASTLYHSFPQPQVKHLFKVFDHCGIYLLIAGSYTPYCLVTLRDHGGWLVFAVIWAIAFAGIATEAWWAYRPRWVSVVVYVTMGWMVVFSLRALVANLNPTGLWLLIAGGLAYTLGTFFYVFKRIKYFHAVWHVFVLAGSTLHFLSVLLFVMR